MNFKELKKATKQRKKLLHELGGECQICKEKNFKKLTLHHKKSFKARGIKRPSGRLAQVQEMIANKDNLEVLCEVCHPIIHQIEDLEVKK